MQLVYLSKEIQWIEYNPTSIVKEPKWQEQNLEQQNSIRCLDKYVLVSEQPC